jgi:sigma-54 dependent transcriptional regulator, acetoin dehydrogenase operon transcriptional activator AcoR
MDRSAEDIKLLFLCTANSCRSQLAEALAWARGDAGVRIYSAGFAPSPVHPIAIQVLSESNIDISQAKSKTLDSLGIAEFDVVITLCDQAAGTCPILPNNPTRVDWNLPDPAAATGSAEQVLEVFRHTRDRIQQLIDDFFDRGYFRAFIHLKRQADLIQNNLSEGIIAHDMNRKIFYFNKAAERITEYPRDEVIGQDCHLVFPNGFCGGVCPFCSDNCPSPCPDSIRQEIDIHTRSGAHRRVDMSLKVMQENGDHPVGTMISFRDCTRVWNLERRLGEIEQFAGIIGRDEKMLDIFDLIRDAADSDVPVLVLGESGTGKELVAAAIHRESARARKLFVPVNCGALPEGLLESELFGHVRGAFTGAIRDKKGRFELADGGTIFLDEIGDISPAMQVKLLRVLQDGCFERVGSEKTVKVDVRVISATNKDLFQIIRRDLYYRLCVVPITLPPLRDRPTDIPLLAEHILGRALKDRGRDSVVLSPEAISVMLSYQWPGNVRELQNWIQFALLKCKGDVIEPEFFPGAQSRSGQEQKKSRKKKLTHSALKDALARAGGNKSAAAQLLGVSRATLYRFIDDNES